MVARIAGEEILLIEILRMAERLPDQYKQLPLPAVYPSLLQRRSCMAGSGSNRFRAKA